MTTLAAYRTSYISAKALAKARQCCRDEQRRLRRDSGPLPDAFDGIDVLTCLRKGEPGPGIYASTIEDRLRMRGASQKVRERICTIVASVCGWLER